MISNEAIYEQAYEEIMRGCANPTEQVMAVHMWESWQGVDNEPDRKAIEARKKEIASLLGVMANESDAVYNDDQYLFIYTRHQYAHKNGIIGLATTPFYQHIEIPLFNHNSQTGLLIKDAVPAFVGPHDLYSHFFEKVEDIPDLGTIGVSEDACEDEDRVITPEEKAKLAGKLIIRHRVAEHPLDYIATSQAEYGDQGYALVDPFSQQQQHKAKQAYIELTQQLQKDPSFTEKYGYPEINVNATLDKAVAIVAYNSCSSSVDPELSWMENLQDNVELTKTLYRAFKEHEQLAAAQKKHGIERKPTIVIYQPQSKEHPIIHAAPTPKLKRAVDSLMKQHGLLASQILSF